MKLETRETKWSPLKALAAVDVSIEELGIPKFNFALESAPILEFSNLMNYDNRQLEEFLTMFGGYKAYLETKVADIDAQQNGLSIDGSRAMVGDAFLTLLSGKDMLIQGDCGAQGSRRVQYWRLRRRLALRLQLPR